MNRAKRSAEFDAKEFDLAKSVSTGKAIVASSLVSGINVKAYNQFKAYSKNDIKHKKREKNSKWMNRLVPD